METSATASTRKARQFDVTAGPGTLGTTDSLGPTAKVNLSLAPLHT